MPAPDTSSSRLSRAASWVFVSLQYLLPHLWLTAAVRWFASRRLPSVRTVSINTFVRMFSVDTAEAEHPVPDGYASLNEFFIRRLRPGARPLAAQADALVSPCDGTVSQCGVISEGRLLQAKGHRYFAAELLDDPDTATQFSAGTFVTIYLAPYNYHRVHMPLEGTLVAERHVPGRLFSVNQATAAAVPRLFARNERRVFWFDTAIGPVAMVMVGALNVGSIGTPWGGTHVAGFTEAPRDLAVPAAPDGELRRGDTVGWFNMGSTVILLLPPGGAELADTLRPGATVRMGSAIGRLTIPAD
jgi:phosphatidylserine decarboxylase